MKPRCDIYEVYFVLPMDLYTVETFIETEKVSCNTQLLPGFDN